MWALVWNGFFLKNDAAIELLTFPADFILIFPENPRKSQKAKKIS